MTKLLRIVLGLSLVAAITLLARHAAAWASFGATNDSSVSPDMVDPALGLRRGNPGSVKPPPANLIIRGGGSGNFSAGGFCLIKVEFLSPEFLIEVERSFYSGFGKPLPVPDGIFLSAVCHLQYHNTAGFQVLSIPPDQGSVRICFAAIPNRIGDIFVFSPPTWTDLDTVVDDLLACSPANQSGFYVRRGR